MLPKIAAHAVLFLCCASFGAAAATVLLLSGWFAVYAWVVAAGQVWFTWKPAREQFGGLLEKRGWRDALPTRELPGICLRIVGLFTALGCAQLFGYVVAATSVSWFLHSPPHFLLDQFRDWCTKSTHTQSSFVMSSLAGLALGLFLGDVWWKYGAHVLMGGRVTSVFIRGRRVGHYKDLQQYAVTSQDQPAMFWGGVMVARHLLDELNMFFLGAPGAGKTTLIKRHMASTISRVKPKSDHRAVVYDFKGDLFPILSALAPGRVLTMNAFDLRCVAWDLAKDIVTIALIYQFSVTLIPIEQGPNRFFSDSARSLLSKVMQVLIRILPGQWTLRDVLLGLENKEYLKQLLGKYPDTANALQFFAVESTFENIHSSIQAFLFPYAPIAASWHRAKRSISLREFVRESWVLHLGAAESIRYQQNVLNQLIIQNASDLTLSQPESRTRVSTLYLDEVRMLGKSEAVSRLLTGGRSKGGRVVLGFQDMDGVQEVFGEKGANELAGLCAAKAILRLDSATTAKWASNLVGDAEWMDYRKSGVNDKTLAGGQPSEQRSVRPAILPSEFMSIPRTSPENGLTGVFLHPDYGAHRVTMPWNVLMSGVPTADPQIPEVVERPDEHQILEPWSRAELNRLGIKASTQTKVCGAKK